MDAAKNFALTAKAISIELSEINGPPAEGILAGTQSVIAVSLVRNTRGYIEKIANQINGTYENGWFDGCSVLIRRLLETLIIECFEAHRISAKIKNSSGDFFHLRDLISQTISEPSWNLGRNCKGALPKLKDIGDKSAHSRRFVAHRSDIEKLLPEIRLVIQELLYLAQLK